MAKFLSKDGKFYMREGKLLRPTNILEVPIVTANLTYNGKVQSPTIYGYKIHQQASFAFCGSLHFSKGSISRGRLRPVLPRYTSATFIDSIVYLHAKLFSPEAKYIPQFLGSVFFFFISPPPTIP